MLPLIANGAVRISKIWCVQKKTDLTETNHGGFFVGYILTKKLVITAAQENVIILEAYSLVRKVAESQSIIWI